MKYYFLTRKDGYIISISNQKPSYDSDKLILIEKEIDEKKIEEIKNSERSKIENGSFEIILQKTNSKIDAKALLEKIKTQELSNEDIKEILTLLLEKQIN